MPAKKQVIKYLPLFQVSDLLLEHLDGQPERGVASRHGGVHGGGLLGAGVLAGDGIGDDRSGRHDNDDDRGASTTEKKKSGFKSDSGISCHRRIGFGSDPTGRTGIDFGVTGAPETFVIDGHGRVRYRHVGPITPEVWSGTLQPMLDRLEQET